jgi:23S rRNA pseudouridine2605 synthase
MIPGDRLNKALAAAGAGSRRHCDDLILAGRVSINGQRVTEPGRRVEEGDRLAVDGKAVEPEKLVYWAVHKPRGVLCTNHDPSGRPLATDLIPHVDQRVYTVGRLDEDSEGLLLLTNDGPMALRLTHPRYGIEKTYRVQVAGSPDRKDIDRLLEGVWLSDGPVKAKRVRRLKSQGQSAWLEIVLSEGKNREIRRMLAQLGHKVMRILRIAIGPLRLDRLPAGKARRVSREEELWLKKMCAQAERRRQRLLEGDEMAAEEPNEETAGESPAPKPTPKPPIPRTGRKGMPPKRPGKPDPRVAGASRPPRENRGDRPTYRGERPGQGDRPPRGDRPSYRGERPGQGDRPPRGDRPPYRGERPGQGERPTRGDRPGPGARPPRGPRPGQTPRGPLRADRRDDGPRPPRPGSLRFEKGESIPSGYRPGTRPGRKPGWKKSTKRREEEE